MKIKKKSESDLDPANHFQSYLSNFSDFAKPRSAVNSSQVYSATYMRHSNMTDRVIDTTKLEVTYLE